jgi:hypothetical protein
MRIRHAIRGVALSHSSPRLGHQPIDLEIVQTRLDPRACARPYLLAHVRSGIPHAHAVGHGTVMLFLSRLLEWLPVRRDSDRRLLAWQ